MRNNIADRTISLWIIPGTPRLGTGPKWQTFLTSLLGGLLFVLVFHWAYSDIPGEFYQVRDDGVITMSHARNLVDYGFIGVNPSGGRVEGYSAPIQLFLYAAAYAVTGIGYAAYSEAQTVAATFLLGVLLTLFFQERQILTLGLTGVAAVFLTFLRPFLLWHGSGMENAVTHVLVLATVLTLIFSIRRGQFRYELIVPVFLASISRIEGIYYIGPLLIVFGGFWLGAFRDWHGVRFSLMVLGLWVLFQLWRYLYFGDLWPNTAYAQNISVADNLRPLLSLNGEHLREVIFQADEMLDFHGGMVPLLAIPALLMLSRRRDTVLLVLLLGVLVLTAAFSQAVFGSARIDPARTTTHLAIVSAVGIFVLLRLLVLHRRLRWVIPAVAGILMFGTNLVEPYSAGWGRSSFHVRRIADVAGTENLFRPTVAYADLGVMSWHKQFNIVDLGSLGHPLMAKLPMPYRVDYLLDYSAPDIVDIQNSWSCLYHEFLSDPRFDERYTPINTHVTSWTRLNCRAAPESQTGLYVRTALIRSSQSAERRLMDQMKIDLSIRRLREELEQCQSLTVGLHDCIYVARTAWRFLPEFLNLGKIDELEEIFATSRTSPFDLFLMTGYRDGQAHQAALRFIQNHH